MEFANWTVEIQKRRITELELEKESQEHIIQCHENSNLTNLALESFLNQDQSGVLNEVFDLLQVKVQCMDSHDKWCVLTMDEVSLKPSVDYDSKSDEMIGQKGMRTKDIAEKFEVSRRTVLNVKKLFEATGSFEKRKSTGRPRSARTEDILNKIKTKVEAEPRSNIRAIARELRVDKMAVNRAVKSDLGLKSRIAQYDLTHDSNAESLFNKIGTYRIVITRMRWILLISCLCGAARGSDSKLPMGEFSLKMPFSKPVIPETYLCTPMKLDQSRTNYVIGFRPDASSQTAHHILIYGCKSPAQEEPIYNCGAMTERTPGYPSALHPCGEGNEIIYAWAQNAPELLLPEGVGFRVGGDTDIQWLVLQVHYASVDHIPAGGDVSGVVLRYTNVEQPKSAGVFFMGSNGRIPAKTTTHMESACALSENKVIHPFAFRVHTHGLGRVVSGWKVVNKNTWTLLGKEDPQLPQMFYPVQNNGTVITQGESMAARCTMVNHRNEAVWVGSTRLDEMCNFYLMYWVHGKDILKKNSCSSIGPPIYSWNGWLLGGGLSNIPDDEASALP
eukprot:maker-scaffold1351_size46012-snap-gene-0.14 protein:Tk06399 transcript:maker-scaffold1351_size46012-snap-gene-0.14-mRNA-1 annotation:"peptidylglycine alpha-hydroxylating monooxygenase"